MRVREEHEGRDESANGRGNGERTGTMIDMKVEGIESRRFYEVVIEVGRKMREGGRCQ